VMDSFYTGVPLFKRLYDAQTLAIGVVHPNRSQLPKALTTTKLATYVHIPFSLFQCLTTAPVCLQR